MSSEYEGSRPSVLVGIPAYNEASTIHEVATTAQQYADEVVVVDDGSEDETRDRARDSGVKLLAHETNRGYGSTLETIFRYAHSRQADHLVIIDGDGQHDESDIPDLIRTQQETGAEIVTGSRFNGNPSTEVPTYRRFGLAIINLLTNLGLRIGYSYPSISDTQCGFRAYDAAAIESMAETSDIGPGMGASIDILFQSASDDHDIIEVPTKIDYDVDHANTRNPIVHGLDLFKSLFLFVARDRPFRIASVGALMMLSVTGAVLVFGLLTGLLAYILVLVLIVLVLAVSLTMSGSSLTRSDGTDR